MAHDDRGYVLITIVAITLALALALLCSRFYVRIKITKNPGWDDVFIVLAIVRDVKVLSRRTHADGNSR